MNISAPTLEQYLKAKEIVDHYESEQDRLSEINKDEEDRFNGFDEMEESYPDYYTCMCCGRPQVNSMSCNFCAGPVMESWY